MHTAAIALQDRAIGAWKGVWSGLKGITAPALFVTGAGHGLMYQDPQKLADVVMDFLDK